MESVLKSFSELPVFQAYLLASVLWSSCLLPSHLLSKLFSKTYNKMLTGPNKTEWLSRCVSNIHAVLVSIILIVAVFGNAAVYKGETYELEWLCRAGLKLAIGYFMYDACLVIATIKTITAGPSTLCHHFGAGLVIHYTLISDSALVIIWAAGIFLTEVSTPFVNARWFLMFRHKDEMIYKVAGVMMALTFFLARIVYMPIFLILLFTSDGLISTIPDVKQAFHFGIIGMFGHLGLYLLNVYWFSLIMKGMMKMIKSMKNKPAGKTQ